MRVMSVHKNFEYDHRTAKRKAKTVEAEKKKTTKKRVGARKKNV